MLFNLFWIHSGDFSIKNRTDGDGVKIEISFPKINA